MENYCTWCGTYTTVDGTTKMCTACMGTWRARHRVMTDLCALGLCAGGGGTDLGLEQAGFAHALLIENDAGCCQTLRANRPGWRIRQDSIVNLSGTEFAGQADLLSAGLPCTPHSRNGKQLGIADERHLWGEALRIISEARPRAVMLETANAILGPKFGAERASTLGRLGDLGYQAQWRVIDASRFGVPQRRKRAILAAFREPRVFAAFTWPGPSGPSPTAGDTLYPLVSSRGWPGAGSWRDGAQALAPVLVGGSKKHGGADLSGSQGKAAWRRLGVNGMGIADEAPGSDGKYARGAGKIFDASDGIMLTTAMAQLLQGFPPSWMITGRKTAAYRQIGNAFPPPAAAAIGRAIRSALRS
jgi:DNA (cytosine-5)-methyltransferase 1